MQTSIAAKNIMELKKSSILKETKHSHQSIIPFHNETHSEKGKSGSHLYAKIGSLSKSGYCFHPDEITEKIHETLKNDPSITAFTIVEDNIAVGFMTRTALHETLGGRYGFTLHSRNPIRDIMNTKFLKVDYNMPVDYVSKLAMHRPFEMLYNPIVVEQNGGYSGIVTVKDLLNTSTKIAQAERDEIAVMKDNLKIGIFFIDKDFIIQEHYSQHLEEILSEQNLSGKSFPEILSASLSAKELEAVKDYFTMIFNHTIDQNIMDDVNPLKDLHYVNINTKERKVFNCDFTVVERAYGKTFTLVAIYDITAEVKLEQQLVEEENKRQREIKTVFELLQVEPAVFNDFLDDAEYEFETIDKILKNKSMTAHKALVEIYQSIHAIKSNAVILGLQTFGDKAHALETRIKKLREHKDVPPDAMQNLVAAIRKLSHDKEGFKVTIKRINSFRSFGNTNTNAKGKSQGEYVLIESLTKTVNKTSEDMGKKVKFIVDKIDNDAIENGPRRVMKETLMQLIRNSVVHGIETPEERAACKKSKTGIIKLSIERIDGNIYIKLRDDGRGLDYNKIAKKAIRLNIIKPEDAKNKKALLKAIFSPGFSTAETEGMHAGRGVGLNLVQDRLRSEKGFINKIKTTAGKGTQFNIVFTGKKRNA